MVAEKQLEEFVSRIQKAAGENLHSVILYGSAAAGDFNPEFSNLNLLCILRDTSYARLSAIAPVVEWWHRQKHPTPLVITPEELEHSTDVFSIELLDMQRHHRVLFGDGSFAGLRIPMHLHRAQLEYELREKIILLRQRFLQHAGNDHDLWALLLASFPAFATLFRHALIALGRQHAQVKARSHSNPGVTVFSLIRRRSCNCLTSGSTRSTASIVMSKTFLPVIWLRCSR